MAFKFTQENFEQEVLNSDVPVLVDFYADWCGPCQMLAPIIEDISDSDIGVKVGKVNVDKACDDITSALENGTEEVKLEWGSYPASDTRVEVSIAHQTLWYIENGKTIFSTPVVTGGPGHGTDKGVFAVTYKATDVDLKGRNDDGSKYSSHVDWWMPFNGDEGLHDADWRGSFGGNIYTYNGSHGCVNMPESAAARLYKKVDAGTIVVVY